MYKYRQNVKYENIQLLRYHHLVTLIITIIIIIIIIIIITCVAAGLVIEKLQIPGSESELNWK